MKRPIGYGKCSSHNQKPDFISQRNKKESENEMSSTATKFQPGDVVRYETLSAPIHHCREGIAIAEARRDGVVLFDTYWQSYGDRHALTYEETETAEVVFNLADYDELERYQSHAAERWRTYRPADRETVTSQHGLQIRWFIRKGAQPDIDTQIENARQVLAEAESKLESAERRVRGARRDLEQLEAKR